MDKINVGELFGKSVDDLQMQAEVQSLNFRNAELQREIEDQRNYIDFLKSQIEQLTETKKEVRYKVVRSYSPSEPFSRLELNIAFNDGWEFVRASEYIPKKGRKGGYIEYILRKEVENERNY